MSSPGASQFEQLVGTDFGPYRVVEVLGHGAAGLHLRGVHQETRRAAQLRVLPAALAADPETLTRFRRQVAALARLEDPAIVRLYDYQLDQDPAWYAVEEVKGEPLAQLIGAAAGPWPFVEVLRLARALLGALETLHGAGLVHRNLTAEAVWHDLDGGFRVVDLGVVYAAGWQRVTAVGEVLGDPAARPPEVLGGAEHSALGDLYQLGRLLWHAAAGEPLDPARPALPPGTQQRALVQGLLARLIDPDPGRRYQDAAQVLRALREAEDELEETRPSARVPPEEAAAAEAAAAVPEATAQTPGPPARRWPWALLAGVLLAAGWAWTTHGPPPEGTLPRDLEVQLSARSVELRWRTGLPTPTAAERRDPEAGEVLRFEARSPPTRVHALRIPLVPGRRYRCAVLAHGRPVEGRDLEAPADALAPSDLTFARPRLDQLHVGFTTQVAARARLEARAPSRTWRAAEAEATTAHQLVLEDLGLEDAPTEATLVVEAEDGARHHLALDPRSLQGPVTRLEDFLRRGREQWLPTLRQVYLAGGLLRNRASHLGERLAAAGFGPAWERAAPLFRQVLADPSVPRATRRRLTRELTELADIDGALLFMETTDLFGILEVADAFQPRTLPLKLPRPGPGCLRLPLGEPLALMGDGVVSAYSHLLATINVAPVPEHVLRFPLTPAQRAAFQAPRLAITVLNHHPGAVLDLFLNGSWIRTAHAHRPTQMSMVGADLPLDPYIANPRFAHQTFAIEPAFLIEGVNTLRIRVRPMFGVPLSETAELFALHLLEGT